MPTGNTHLDRLTLTNYRCFGDFTLALDPQLTVLVARNGMGKSAVLDACAMALRTFVSPMVGTGATAGFYPGDGRWVQTPEAQMIPQFPVALRVDGVIAGHEVRWTRWLPSSDSHTRTSPSAKKVRTVAAGLKADLAAYARGALPAAPDLPVMAHYGTGRLWSEGRLSGKKAHKATSLNAPTNGYVDCLDPRSGYAAFTRWFEAVSREAQRTVTVGASSPPHGPLSFVRAVQRATDAVLRPAGWHSLQWSFYLETIVAQHATAGELSVAALSDGVRNAIGLVADLAHRCVRLNPHLGEDAPRRTAGVVLIDEVDMHLHPGWQQLIVRSLCEAFPRVQFIVSTHSPQVLSTIPHRCIRVLDEGTSGLHAHTPSEQTEGVPAPDVMVAVMDVAPSADLPIRRDLERYRAMIQDDTHESVEGVALRARLEQHYGSRHLEITDLDRLVRFRRATRTARRGDRG